MVTALEIVNKAKELGYDACGIIPIEKVKGYEEKLDELVSCFPEEKDKYEGFRAFASPQNAYPWAKAIVVSSYWYGKYQIPENLKGHIGKYYLIDGRKKPESTEHKTSAAFEAYLKEQGLTVGADRSVGVTAARWAAMQAGIGIIRKNNFLYSERGSWQYIEAFLIDQDLEYINTCELEACDEGCNLCLQACPTKSLSRPYMMNRTTCVSNLTCWDGWDLTTEPLREQFDQWIYGCDACQDVCPHNQNAWENTQKVPGLDELSKHLSLIQIVESDYSYLEQVVNSVFWYIPKEYSWRYKTNALNAMLNCYKPEYLSVIERACHDEKEPVRKMAEWVLKQIQTV